METQELKTLLDYLRRRENDNNFVETYLLSGLSSKRNLNGRMTPDLFYKYFYVNKKDAEEQKIDSLIKELFENSEHNVLALQAHGGSGKSVFVNLLEIRSQIANLEKVIIDFESSSDIGFKSVINQVLHCTRKWLNLMFSPKETQAFQVNFRTNALSIMRVLQGLNDLKLEELWEKAVEDIFSFENIDLTQRINRVIRSLSFERLSEITEGEQVKGVQIACLLLATLMLSRMDDKKYLVIFDNIEAVSNSLIQLPEVISKTWAFLNKIFDMVGLDFCTKITYVISVRTTTNIILTSLHDDIFWNAGNRFIYALNYEDFCAEALLKKLKFLHDYDFKKSKLYGDLYLLCSFVCKKSVIDMFLEKGKVDSKSAIEYKVFAKEKLAPFFGNNFRLVISSLCEFVTNINKNQRIRCLLNIQEKESFDINVNGARAILFNTIFSNLARNSIINGCDSIFSYFGINTISGKQKHSITRVLLAFLYWDFVKGCMRNSTEYRGASLKRIVDSFRYHYTNQLEFEEFAELIYRLSQYTAKDNEKNLATSNWSYLLWIKVGVAYRDRDSFVQLVMDYYNRKPNVDLEEARINLSDAGLCYIMNISNQFEFYNARTDDFNSVSLFMLDNEKEGKGLYKFEKMIETNYNTINNFVYGMINKGTNACAEYNKCKGENLCYKECKNTDGYDTLNCSMFIRYLEISATIIEAINYIDRYRLYLLKRFDDFEADNKLLNLIQKYAKLLEEIRLHDNMFESFSTKTFISKYSNNTTKAKLKAQGLTRFPQNAFYYYGNKRDLIFDAIEYEKKNHSGYDLYKICKDKLYISE